jgi:hypothetical protein
MSLHNPLMRQVLAQSQEPRRRQLDWLTALEERAHDVRSQMGQSNKRSEVALAYSEAFGHCLDAVVRPRNWLRIANASPIKAVRPALISAPTPFSMTI